ncbi:AAA family ATPase [Empedobacter brevis]|uniref:AAA family ATPase n=1 Tax=Empedobacter brevis TaxID=247 RepID=UPI00334256D2
MLIKNLHLKNIGPFIESKIDFSNKINSDNSNVTIITGENGTGKSIILDSIRTLLMGIYETVERDICSSNNFLIDMNLTIDAVDVNIHSKSKKDRNGFNINNHEINNLFHNHLKTKYKRNFIFDYWTTKLSNDKFNLSNIEALKTNDHLDSTLSGIHKNIDVTRTIAFFDYLKDSKNKSEKELGGFLYKLVEKIINNSLSNGELSHVSRIDLTALVNVQGKDISLDKLSSGNLYLITRMISLIRQIYAICTNFNIPIKEYKSIQGVLLIDEAENHLHPKWQKKFLANILEIFPNIQIILTTHSPFIVSSIKDSRIYVCKSFDSYSEIIEETDFYTNSPIEEILRSPLFNTNSFNSDITNLIELRKKHIENNENEKADIIEKKLLKINPEYFSYLTINKVLKNLK